MQEIMLEQLFTMIGCCLFALKVFWGFYFVLKTKYFCRNDVIYIFVRYTCSMGYSQWTMGFWYMQINLVHVSFVKRNIFCELIVTKFNTRCTLYNRFCISSFCTKLNRNSIFKFLYPDIFKSTYTVFEYQLFS